MLPKSILQWACSEYNGLDEFQTSFPDYIFCVSLFIIQLQSWVLNGVCSSLFKKPFGTTFKPRTISSVIVPVMPLVCCLNYTKIVEQSCCHKKIQNEAALLMVISLYSIKILSSEIFEIYQEITEIEMTQFITQLLWFPAELRCSITVIMQFLQNNM